MNGTANMVFKLFDAAAAGAQVGQTITANGVSLVDGRFTIELDFTNGGVIPGVFDGNDRWLEITVNGILLAPREKLTAAPHAVVASILSLPCAERTTAPMALELVSDSDVGQERVLRIVTNSTQIGATAVVGEALGAGNNENVGVYGHSISANGFGVTGTNTSATGNCTGVYGTAASTSGIGVLGLSSAATGNTRGVYGRVSSPDGYAGFFEGRGYFSQPLGIRTIGAPQAMVDIQSSFPGTGLALNADGRLFVKSTSDFVGVNRSSQITGLEYFGVRAPVVGNSYGGMYVETTSATGRPFYGYAANGDGLAWTYLDANTDLWHLNTNGTNRITVGRVNGRVGIGRTSTANDLEVEGTASKTVAGNWAANSDARIKTDVRTVDDALSTLDRVRLVSFRYSGDYRRDHPTIADHRYLNVIAQEFRGVFPDAVTGSGEKLPNGDEILQVDTYPLTIYTAAAVQELHRIIQEKDGQLDRQAQALADLQARVARLESGAQQAGFRAAGAER
jgi:hypothetical protein